MENPADNNYPVHAPIRRRWSPREFADQPVDDATLCSLFEAARWAPSSYNDQPWSFIVGTQDRHPETYGTLLDCLVEGNQSWAKHAPVLGLSVARRTFRHSAKPNRHALHDVGLAMANLIIEATSRDLFVHPMAGFHVEKAQKTFEVPDDHDPVAAFALGHPADPGERSDEARERRALAEFVFSGRWGVSSDIVD